jgi:glycosyltransferase involved in cell wall biosynthesis
MPYPLTDGGAIGIYNITKSLAELGHQITLVTYPLDTKEATDEAVRDLSRFAIVRLVSRPLPPRWKVLARTIFHGAYPIERRMMPAMFELLRTAIAAEQFDVVHVDHSHMGKYGEWIKREYGLPVVLREHNYESLIYQRYAETETNPLKRAIARVHGSRLKIEEDRILRSVDGIAAISEVDAMLIRVATPETPIVIIPAGVDTEYFRPTDIEPEPNSILWIGSLEWDPNFDAVRYFCESIFPLILERSPTSILNIIGGGQTKIRRLASRNPHIRLLGKVRDVRDYLARSAVLIVPLRAGGGMRLKLLDYFASGKAVVSTSIGAEGNKARDGIHLLIRDDSEAFADGVLCLLANPALREFFAQNAHALVETEYSWRQIANNFIAFYEEVLAINTNV